MSVSVATVRIALSPLLASPRPHLLHMLKDSRSGLQPLVQRASRDTCAIQKARGQVRSEVPSDRECEAATRSHVFQSTMPSGSFQQLNGYEKQLEAAANVPQEPKLPLALAPLDQPIPL